MSNRTGRTTARAAVGIATLTVLLGATACGSAPDEVQQALQARHPGAGAEWEQQPYGWEAVLYDEAGELEVEFSGAGQWLETEREVDDGAGFPPAVLAAIEQAQPYRQVSKWEIEQTPQGEFYEIEIEFPERELYFAADGSPAPNSHEDA